MRKNISLLLVLCLCFCLAACGAAAPTATASPTANAEPAAESTAPSAEPTPEPTPEPVDLQPLVDSLNEEETAHHSEDDPSIAVFEVGSEENTIRYKFAMHIFQYVIMMAESGDAENLNAYNRLLDSLPALEESLENALRESLPDLKIQVVLMADEYTDTVCAVVEDGEIVYDLVNGVGDAPEGITSIVKVEELTPEEQAELEAMLNDVINSIS